MSGHLVYVFVVGVLAGGLGWYPWGRWVGNRALDRAWDEGYDARRQDEPEARPVEVAVYECPICMEPGCWGPSDARHAVPPSTVVGHTIYPELAALAADDVPEPGHAVRGDPASGWKEPSETAGLGHPSPYAGPLTPAQRRRDKHKQRGTYQPGDPEPSDDTLTNLFAEFGTWEQQLAAIDASDLGLSPWGNLVLERAS